MSKDGEALPRRPTRLPLPRSRRRCPPTHGNPSGYAEIDTGIASADSACNSTKGERRERGKRRRGGEGDLEEVPRDGETREAGAEDRVPQGAAAVPSSRRGRGGGGCDGSPGIEAEAE